MKVIHQNLRKGEIKVKVDNKEDLWYLTNIIDINDVIEGRTFRKIKLSSSDERSSNVIKRPVFLSILVDKVEFSSSGDTLRISGTVNEGFEDIPKGSHHTFNVEEHSEFKIIKEEWLGFQVERVKEACEGKKSRILMVVFDREEAFFALTKSYSYEILNHLKGDVQNKRISEKIFGNFYSDIIGVMKEYVSRYDISHVILASPSFWKEELLKELKDDSLKEKIVQATCSSVDKNAFNEVMKRDEVKKALEEERLAAELKIVDLLLAEISKENLAAYGFKNVRDAVESGAVKDIIVSTGLIAKKRSSNSYGELDYLLRSVDKMKGFIHIINSDHDGGRKLDGLGGIGAILRYRLNY